MSTHDKAMLDSTDVLSMALAWFEAGRKIALATVIETSGSSPRPVGSNLVIAADGAFEGSVSGCCVESAVVSAAQYLPSHSTGSTNTRIDPPQARPTSHASASAKPTMLAPRLRFGVC